jgi:hypothetical protein
MMYSSIMLLAPPHSEHTFWLIVYAIILLIFDHVEPCFNAKTFLSRDGSDYAVGLCGRVGA